MVFDAGAFEHVGYLVVETSFFGDGEFAVVGGDGGFHVLLVVVLGGCGYWLLMQRIAAWEKRVVQVHCTGLSAKKM